MVASNKSVRMYKLKTFFKNYFHMLHTGQSPLARRGNRVPPESWDEIDEEELQGHTEIKKEKKKHITAIILFFLTFLTTTLAGIHFSLTGIPSEGISVVSVLLTGFPYSITVMLILFSHEMGHYLAARRFGVQATLPFFLPFPTLFGTAGAIIKIKSIIPDRRALFYIGVMGPVIGFIFSVLALGVGIYLSEIKLTPVAAKGTLLYFGEPLLFKFFVYIFHGPLPAGHDVYLSPYGWAGWFGCLITSLNLMPIGQLDGGHILYALIGRKQIIFGWLALVAIAILSINFSGWILWIVITLLVLMIAHPPVAEGQKLTFAEKLLGWSAVVILVISFIPVPVKMM